MGEGEKKATHNGRTPALAHTPQRKKKEKKGESTFSTRCEVTSRDKRGKMTSSEGPTTLPVSPQEEKGGKGAFPFTHPIWDAGKVRKKSGAPPGSPESFPPKAHLHQKKEKKSSPLRFDRLEILDQEEKGKGKI